MGIKKGIEKPSIHVYYSFVHKDASAFRTLLYGMEEEGVPAYVKEKQERLALRLGYEAALDSSLGVGIGIGGDNRIVVHYSKMPEGHGLFQINQNETGKLRILGANAARLVKGIPFKQFEDNRGNFAGQEEAISKEEIAAIVKIVVKKLLELNGKGENRSESIRAD